MSRQIRDLRDAHNSNGQMTWFGLIEQGRAFIRIILGETRGLVEILENMALSQRDQI